jgi:glucose/arabinose dehydrogenase
VTTVIELYDPEIRFAAASHNIGRLLFDGEGNLWVPAGERGVSERARDPSSNLGKILRIVPNRDPEGSGYLPAPGNPSAGDPGASPDVYAIGLRHPFSASFDRLGRLWVGDVGANSAEEIDLVTEPGQDFGWPDHEGPCVADCEGVEDPSIHWVHGSGHPFIRADDEAEATSQRVAWVGPEVRPADADPYGGALDGALIFGDSCVGFLRAARIQDDGAICDEPIGHLSNVVDMRQALDGTLYAVTFGTCNTGEEIPPGRLWRLELADE